MNDNNYHLKIEFEDGMFWMDQDVRFEKIEPLTERIDRVDGPQWIVYAASHGEIILFKRSSVKRVSWMPHMSNDVPREKE